jgi:hypothetical protein
MPQQRRSKSKEQIQSRRVEWTRKGCAYFSCVARQVQDNNERPKIAIDTIPDDDHEFACLTLGPSVFGAAEGRPSHRVHEASVYFKSPVAVGDHWPERLGSVTLDKLYRTRLAFVASAAHTSENTPDRAAQIVERLETRAYNAMRALLIQGNPFEIQAAGLEIRRVFDAGRFREEAAFMRPRTSHPWEKICSIDGSALETAAVVTRSIERIFDRPDEFSRLQRGLDHWDQATMEHRLDLLLHTLVRAIEALVAPEQGRTQGQFVDRCKTIIRAAHSDRLLNEIYELRSQVEHSNDWRLAFKDTRPSLSDEDAEPLATLRAFQIELIARRAYLRVLFDPTFMESLRTDEEIRRFWLSPGHARIWGNRMNLESEVRSFFDPHKAEIFQQVTKIDLA